MNKKKINFRDVKVIGKELLSPHLMRIKLSGEDLTDFPTGQEGAYVKVVLHETKTSLENKEGRPKMRSYTVAEFDDVRKVLSLDFMVNNHSGHTSDWALSVEEGESLVLAGPGPRKINDFIATDYLMFGDLTSVNVVRAYVKYAPKEATGKAYIFAQSKEDIREFSGDNQIKVNWIVADESDYFLEKAKAYENLSEDTIVFGAGEATRITSLRNYLLKEKELSGERVFLSGYWKEGRSDEQYRAEKHKNR